MDFTDAQSASSLSSSSSRSGEVYPESKDARARFGDPSSTSETEGSRRRFALQFGGSTGWLSLSMLEWTPSSAALCRRRFSLSQSATAASVTFSAGS